MTVYVGARDLQGIAFVGTHQFILAIPDTPTFCPAISPLTQIEIKLIQIGNKTGFTFAGHNVSGRLQIVFNQKSDVDAAIEAISKKIGFWNDWDAELKKVAHNKGDVEYINTLVELTGNYIINERETNSPYSAFSNNCNRWAQSVIEYAGGTVGGDFSGYDPAHDKRLDKAWFGPACIKPGKAS